MANVFENMIIFRIFRKLFFMGPCPGFVVRFLLFTFYLLLFVCSRLFDLYVAVLFLVRLSFSFCFGSYLLFVAPRLAFSFRGVLLFIGVASHVASLFGFGCYLLVVLIFWCFDARFAPLDFARFAAVAAGASRLKYICGTNNAEIRANVQ